MSTVVKGPSAAPLVSVLIPSYNSEKWIEETLESVIAQSYRPLEILISDDASQDATPEILRSVTERYPDSIRLYLWDERRGVTINSQFLLSKASGDFVCPFAHDDIMLPGKIEAQVRLLQSRAELAACYHDCVLFEDESGRNLFRYSERMPKCRGTLRNLIVYNTFFSLNTAMIRREYIPPCGYDTTAGDVCDWLLLMEVAARVPESSAEPIGRVDGVYVRYRRHPRNLSARYRKEVFDHTMRSLDKIQALVPGHTWAVSIARSERSFTFLVKGLLTRQFDTPYVRMLSNIVKNPFGLIFALKNALRYWRARRTARLSAS